MGAGELEMTNCAPLGMALTALPTSPGNAPEALVSLAEMYLQLRLDPTGSPPSHPDDSLIETAVQAATEELCGPNGEGWLGRALVAREYRLDLNGFPGGALGIPLPPLQSVTGVSYLDGDGVEQVLDPAAYTVFTAGTPGTIRPAYNTAWPTSIRRGAGAVSVRFIAGYPDPSDIPAPIRQWIKARAGFFYENRESIISGTIATELPGFPAMLENYRVRGVFKP